MSLKMSENQNMGLVINSPATAREYFTEHYGNIRRYLLSLTSSHIEADDLAQETYLRAIYYINAHGPPRKPFNWLRSVAYRIFISKRRAQYSEEGNLNNVGCSQGYRQTAPLEAICLLEQGVSMQRAFGRLEPIEKTLMAGFYREGRTYEELARQCNLSKNAVKIRLCRARQKLRLREE